MKLKSCSVLRRNRMAWIQRDSCVERLKKLLRFHPSGYEYVPSYKYYQHQKHLQKIGEIDSDEELEGWDGYKYLIWKNGRVPAGLYRAMKDDLEKKAKIKFKENEELAPVFFHRKGQLSKDKKWLFQNDCVKAMLENAEQGGGLILNATGTGKTKIAGMFFSWLEGNAVFIVDELTLLKQARKSLQETLGEKIGIVGESKFRPRRITVATIQTIHKYRHNPDFKKWTKQLSVMIIDEVHIQLNKRNFQTTAAINPPAIFGLTATLAMKKDSVRMIAYSLCGPVVYKYPLKQGQADGVLDHGIIVQVKHNHPHETKHYRSRAKSLKQYMEDYTELIVECDKRNQIVYDLVKEALKRKKYVVVLVERVAHIHEMSRLFRKFPHSLAFGHVAAKDRFAAVKSMNDGETNLIVANTVFKKGIDLSRLNVIIDAAAKKSAEDAIQKFGRGVRKHADKNGLIYFDIADENNRFEKAASKRKSAFKSVGVPIIKLPANIEQKHGWAKSIFDNAESQLNKLTNKH